MWTRIKRLFRHRWQDETATRRALPPALLERLQQRIAVSEQSHTGEIRIYVETALPLSDLLQNRSTPKLIRSRALAVFAELGIWDTAQNNGVLIYLLVAEHAIEVIADRGLNPWVDEAAWKALVGDMSAAFKRGDYEGGLTHALDEVSALLARYFPSSPQQHNPNELPDTLIVR